MTLPSLECRTDEALHQEIKSLRGNECETIAEVVLHLHEIDLRGTYRDAGYPSLFKFCTEGLGYSEGSAWRRVEAARALKGNPEIYELLRAGKITLCGVAAVAKVLTPENKSEVLTLAQGQPKLEVERIAARYGKAKEPKRGGSVRVVKRSCSQSAAAPGLFAKREEPTEERFSVTLELTKEEFAVLEQARALVGVRQLKDVVVKTAQEFVARRTRKPRSVRTKRTVSTVKVIKPLKSRYITNAVKREVRERDGERCTYVSPDGRRCSECRGLQFDHVQPFALGGGNEAQNLRLVCAGHNRLFAERVFGRETILNYARASGGK